MRVHVLYVSLELAKFSDLSAQNGIRLLKGVEKRIESSSGESFEYAHVLLRALTSKQTDSKHTTFEVFDTTTYVCHPIYLCKATEKDRGGTTYMGQALVATKCRYVCTTCTYI